MNKELTTSHTSAGLDEDEDGFIDACCICGWHSGSVPDGETATDALMAHAYAKGFNAGATVERAWAAR